MGNKRRVRNHQFIKSRHSVRKQMWSNDAHLELPVQQLSCQSYPENTHTHTVGRVFRQRKKQGSGQRIQLHRTCYIFFCCVFWGAEVDQGLRLELSMSLCVTAVCHVITVSSIVNCVWVWDWLNMRLSVFMSLLCALLNCCHHPALVVAVVVCHKPPHP